MRVEVVSDLGRWSEEWDAMVEAQRLASPFLLSWWVPAAAGAPAAILLCLDGDRLVGGAAFELDRVGKGRATIERVRALGQGALAPDHIDVVAAEGSEDDVLTRVLGWLRRPGNRLVDLDGLAADGRLARALAPDEIDRVTAPSATLPTDIASYLAERPGQVRSTISRTRKRLTKAGGAVRRVPAGDADRALDDLARLHDQRWADESGFLQAWDRFRRAARAGMATGAVTMHEAVDGEGRVVATELDLVSGGRVAFYQAGRSTEREWRGVGSVVRSDVIGEAIGRQAREYDLLRGDEAYKADWSTGHRDIVRVRFGVGAIGRTVAFGARSWRAAQPAARRARAVVAKSVSSREASG